MISSCKSTTEVLEECGISTEWEAFGTKWFSGMEGTTRVIFILPEKEEPSDICSKEHVSPYYKLLTDVNSGIKPADFEFTALAAIPNATPRTEVMEVTSSSLGRYETNIDVGLAQAYADRPGFFSMQILARFPTLGDWPKDSTYLASYVQAAYFKLEYRKHK